MHYTIDFDTRKPEAKHDDREVLVDYIEDNDLGIAVALIDGPDELVLQFSLEELTDLYSNLTGEELNLQGKPDAEDFAANRCWKALEDADVPKFTKGLGNKLLKAASKRTRDVPELSSDAKADKPTSKASSKPKKQDTGTTRPASKGVRANQLKGMTFTHGPNTPRPTASFKIFTDFLDENLGEATFDELVNAFKAAYVPRNPDKPVDDALGRAYVRDAFNAGYIEETL